SFSLSGHRVAAARWCSQARASRGLPPSVAALSRKMDLVPVDQRYFEDYRAGSVFECGSITVEQSEMIAFAKRYDPQALHTDPAAAARSIYGGLIASGWHTAAMTMRLLVAKYLSGIA